MSILSKFKVTPITISTDVFVENDKKQVIKNSHGKAKVQNKQNNIEKERQIQRRELKLPESTLIVKLHNQDGVALAQGKTNGTDQKDQKQTYIYSELIFNQGAEAISWDKESFCNKYIKQLDIYSENKLRLQPLTTHKH